MKKLSFILLITLFSGIVLWAKPVDVQKAQQIAEQFLYVQSKISNIGTAGKKQLPAMPQKAQQSSVSQRFAPITATGTMSQTMQKTGALRAMSVLPETSELQNVENPLGAAARAEFYVFNRANDGGFIIVSADDCVLPILGYTESGNFNPEKLPVNVQKWLEGYCREIRYAVEHNAKPTTTIQAKWNGFSTPASTQAVAPLLQTTWDQSPYYNQLCPTGTPTGCVATAMAQIMKFWNHPAQGTGSHSYQSSSYGTLSANFGATTYNWASMPNSLTSSYSTGAQRTAVATLMYHCGVAVEMNYAPNGSGAYSISYYGQLQYCAENAFKNYFGYNATTVQGILRDSYSGNWLNLLKTELDAGRPILYSGHDSQAEAGHAFVCDGYNASNYFHFNWGWSGHYDGYFLVDNLNPDGTGIGGGTGSYNSGQDVVIGIMPSSTVTPPPSGTPDLKLNSAITVSPNPAVHGSPYSFSANIKNFGTGSFTGDIAIAFYDAAEEAYYLSYYFMQSVTLAANAPQNRSLQFTGTELPVGTHYVALAYKASTATQWAILDGGSYDYYTEFEVTDGTTPPDPEYDLQMNSAITLSLNPVPENSAFTISASVKNKGTVSFTGKILAGILNMNIANEDEMLVTMLETNTVTVNAGGTYDASFQSSGLPVGNYAVMIGYETSDGEQDGIGEDGNEDSYIFFSVTVLSAVKDIDAAAITIYPNPVQEKLIMDNGKLTVKDVEIVDLTGKIIMNCQLSTVNSINVSTLPTGVYFVKINTDKGLVVKKFVKE